MLRDEHMFPFGGMAGERKEGEMYHQHPEQLPKLS
jgi:hypothetical protein